VFRLGNLVVCFLMGAVSAHAAGPAYNVNSFSDAVDAVGDGVCATSGGVCTLRAALMEANYYAAHSGTEEVTIFLQLGTYILTIPPNTLIGVDEIGGDLDIFLGKVRVVGKGAGISGGPATTIQANHGDRVFAVDSSDVQMEDLCIRGGRPPNLSVRASKGYGGGIWSRSSALRLLRCQMTDNITVADTYGGGIYVEQGSLTITESSLRVNSSPDGGAIANNSGTVTINRSTLNNNTAGLGGAMWITTGFLKMSNSTVSDNYAAILGGGLYAQGFSTLRLNNVTLGINHAAGSGGPGPAGGGVQASGNTALTLSNSILLNTGGNLAAIDDLLCGPNATVDSNGHNVILASGNCPVVGGFSAADPQVQTLAANGGATLTRALTPGTIAVVNAGTPTGCDDPDSAPLTTDQRGVKRPIGAACDLGAFELEPLGDANGDGLVTVADVFYLINFLFAGGPLPLGRANVNGGSTIDIADVFYLVNFLFAGGPAPV
jgi:Right handed beta helix region